MGGKKKVRAEGCGSDVVVFVAWGMSAQMLSRAVSHAIEAEPGVYFVIPPHSAYRYWNDILSATPAGFFITELILRYQSVPCPLERELREKPRPIIPFLPFALTPALCDAKAHQN